MPTTAKSHSEFCDCMCFCCLKKSKTNVFIQRNEKHKKEGKVDYELLIQKFYWQNYYCENEDYPKVICNACKSRLLKLEKEEGNNESYKFKNRLKYEELYTRLTRNQTKCECFVCCEGRSNLVRTKPPIVNLLEISNENIEEKESTENVLCAKCYGEKKQGKKHVCNAIMRQKNLSKELLKMSESARERVLSNTISSISKTSDSKELSLTTFGPNKLSLKIVDSSNSIPKPYFTHETLNRLQLKLSNSDAQMKELASFLRMELKSRSSVQPGYKNQLVEKNSELQSLFSTSSFQVQYKQQVAGTKKKEVKYKYC